MKPAKHKNTTGASRPQSSQNTSSIAAPTARTYKPLLAGILTKRFALNYFSTMLFIVSTYLIITYVNTWHQNNLGAFLNLEPVLNIPFKLTIHELFLKLIWLYAIVLIPFYACCPWIHSKAFIFLRGLFAWSWFGNSAWSRRTWQAGRALILKFYFGPLMLNWCLDHIGNTLDHFHQVYWGLQAEQPMRVLFDNGLFWACFQTILFVDTFLYTLGYIIEMPWLKNKIKSVEPTFFGWFVCLMCYPPFNGYTNDLFPWQSTDFPGFQSDSWHFALNICILVLMGVYSWCSVALGFKASNLTNRGIVSHGPYAWVRHPAYVCKNTAWWIGSFPTFFVAFGGGFWGGVYSVTCTAGWSLIYMTRALTEERHLLMADNGYREYMQKVKWRFIPGIF